MADESKALSQTLLRTVGLGQSIIVGAAIVFVGWMWLTAEWQDLLCPSTALSPELVAVTTWLGRSGRILVILFLSALLGELWLGIIRALLREHCKRRVRNGRSNIVGKGVFSDTSLACFAAHAEKASEVDDLDLDQARECQKQVALWVLEQSNRTGTLQGDSSLTYEHLRSEAELRAGLLPWGPLVILITCGHLNDPPIAVFLGGVLFAVCLAIAFVVSAHRRWLAANSYLLTALSDDVDWARFARIAAGL